MIIRRKSVISGLINTRNIPVNPEDLAAYEAGGINIQDAMPYLSSSDREFILSGITSFEWNSLFLESTE